jgi:hypothetical protein
MTGQRLSRHRVGRRDRQCVGDRSARPACPKCQVRSIARRFEIEGAPNWQISAFEVSRDAVSDWLLWVFSFVDRAHVDRHDLDRVPPGGGGLGQPVRGVISGAALHLPQQPCSPDRSKKQVCHGSASSTCSPVCSSARHRGRPRRCSSMPRHVTGAGRCRGAHAGYEPAGGGMRGAEDDRTALAGSSARRCNIVAIVG